MSLTEPAAAHVEAAWDDIMPVLVDYVRIPNVSEAFDAQWREHGYMDEAVELVRSWCAGRDIEGASVEVHELPGRTPMLVIVIPSFNIPTGADPDDTVLLYGHLDKQPEMEGWREGLGPWTPVIEGDRLYGRGGADDGYAAFASLAAIEAVRAAGGTHARCVVLIEASEESGSPDLPFYVDSLASVIGTPSLVVCLDSGCLTYDRLWVTTSLRGLVSVDAKVEIVTAGLHSGDVSGMVPSTFRIVRTLLSRVEDEATGRVLLPSCVVEIPGERIEQARLTASEIGDIADHYPFVEGAVPMQADGSEQLLARTWRAALSVVGAAGLPPVERAGNVLRPSTTLKVSIRIPPTADADKIESELIEQLTTDVPYGAKVTISARTCAPGWHAPATAEWLAAALEEASLVAFGEPSRMFGEGGTIPFMGMLGEKFPQAQFVVTGALGPDANAHGPNEYLHLPTARKITLAVSEILHAHGTR